MARASTSCSLRLLNDRMSVLYSEVASAKTGKGIGGPVVGRAMTPLFGPKKRTAKRPRGREWYHREKLPKRCSRPNLRRWSMSEPVIEVQDLAKVYPDGTRAVAGVSFRVERGEFFGFLGPNGAGKSTTIKML